LAPVAALAPTHWHGTVVERPAQSASAEQGTLLPQAPTGGVVVEPPVQVPGAVQVCPPLQQVAGVEEFPGQQVEPAGQQTGVDELPACRLPPNAPPQHVVLF
jgi:hypothetical protein